jgi:hypothetical protein
MFRRTVGDREQDYENFKREFIDLCRKYNCQIYQSYPDSYAIADWYDHNECLAIGSGLDTPDDTKRHMYISACNHLQYKIYSAIGSWLAWYRQILSQEEVINKLAGHFENNSDWILIEKNRDKLTELYTEACTQYDTDHPVRLRANPPSNLQSDYSLIDWEFSKQKE